MLVENKSFIITGGLGAIGAACARQILAKGGWVVIFDVQSTSEGTVKTSTYHSERALYWQCDITDIKAMESICKEVLEKIPKGSLAGAVHCAGIAPGRKWSHRLVDSAEDFKKVFNVNAFGTFAVNACVADAINSQYPDEGPFGARSTEERGCIINMSSIVAKPVPARCLTYGPSKTAVLGITEGLADFLGPYGIRVNSVAPCAVASSMMGPDRIPFFNEELEVGSIFPRRLSQPDEVAHGCMFLIENPMMNDFHLRIDAGFRGSTVWTAGTDPRQRAISLE